MGSLVRHSPIGKTPGRVRGARPFSGLSPQLRSWQLIPLVLHVFLDYVRHTQYASAPGGIVDT